MKRWDDTHFTLSNNEYWTSEYIRPDYFKEMFMDGYKKMQKDFPEKSNMEIIDEIFDAYRNHRKYRQKPYVRPKGPGVRR